MTESRLDAIADAVTDGQDIDWQAALEGASDEERALLEQLRLVSHISRHSAFPPGTDSVRDARHWGPFDLVEEVDRGSYGHVLRARDTRVDRDVALKLLPAGNPDDDHRVVSEARALGSVRHPNVVAVYGADRFDGVPGLWMEYVEGITLEQFQRVHGTLGAREVILVGVTLCGALSAVHAAGLVHGDIKASNVMRQVGGRIVLTDFGGVLRGAAEGGSRLVGTPLYMAPELLEGASPSVATDVYALGVLLFNLVTGAFPVTGTTVATIRDAHRGGARRLAGTLRPDISPALAAVIERATSPVPSERFASAAEMQRALAGAFDMPVTAEPAPRRRWLARRVPLNWSVAAVILAAAIGGYGWLYERVHAPYRRSPELETRPRLTDDQLALIRSYDDLGDMMATRAEWGQAGSAYRHASALFESTMGTMSPAAAIELAKAAYADQQAGTGTPEIDYVTALFRMSDKLGPIQPAPAAVNTARAVALQQRGEFAQAAQALIDATNVRGRLLRPADIAAPPVPLDAAALERELRQTPPTLDSDGDGLPDVIERAVGLDPASADSDGNGVPDEEEDTDGDGITNGLEWAVIADPANAMGIAGGADPFSLGAYEQEPGESWAASVEGPQRGTRRVRSDNLMAFGIHLSEAKRQRALERGWRLFTRMHVRSGETFAALDLLPGPVFSLSLVPADDDTSRLRLISRNAPRESRDVEIDAAHLGALFELSYDPKARSAVFRMNGRTVTRDYGGFADVRSAQGLLWGASTDQGAAARADGEFSLVMLEIR